MRETADQRQGDACSSGLRVLCGGTEGEMQMMMGWEGGRPAATPIVCTRALCVWACTACRHGQITPPVPVRTGRAPTMALLAF